MSADRCRGVKNVKRASCPMNSEVASSTAAQLSGEIEFRQIRALPKREAKPRHRAAGITPIVLRLERRSGQSDQRNVADVDGHISSAVVDPVKRLEAAFSQNRMLG